MRVLHGEPTRPFKFKVLGQLCSIGGHSAVAEMFGFKLSGFFAWFAWRGVYLFKLPAWSRRIQVGFDWAWLLLFPRDLSHIKTNVTDRVTHAHYEPGDYIIRQGEPAASFYVIEKGEVEVVRSSPEKPAGEVIATLGTGNFFGEQALLGNRPRAASVRARTPAEIVVLGRNVFTTISGSLAPLKMALTQALNRRSTAFWVQRPEATRVLQGLKLADFTEPAPTPLLKPTDTLLEVMRIFAKNTPDFFYVSADGVSLDGVVTLTDLLRAQSQGLPAESPADSFMSKGPVTVAAGDSVMVAAAAFREHGFKYLPIVADQQGRRIVGFVRARKLMASVMQQVSGNPA
jgi:NADH dehydrogenase